MGLAAQYRTAQAIHRASQGDETHCTSQGTGIPCTNAEELVVAAVVVVVVVVVALVFVIKKLRLLSMNVLHLKSTLSLNDIKSGTKNARITGAVAGKRTMHNRSVIVGLEFRQSLSSCRLITEWT